MGGLPGFAMRLGLEPGADERAVKRAYARELKKIDQEAEPERFQALRADYEAALQWARQGGPVDAFVSAVPEADESSVVEVADEAPELAAAGDIVESMPQAQGAGDLPDDSGEEEEPAAREHPAWRLPVAGADLPLDVDAVPPQMLAAAVLDEFMPAVRDKADKDDLRERLRNCLSDPRLASLDAQQDFELQVLTRLADGWRPGYHLLYSVGRDVFDWRDSRRLRALGEPGRFMDEALREAAAFNQQNDNTRVFFLGMIRRLRAEPQPNPDDVHTDVMHAEQLVRRFPHLAALLTSMENFRTWQRESAELRMQPQSSHFGMAVLAFVILVVAAVLGLAWGGDTVDRWRGQVWGSRAVSAPMSPDVAASEFARTAAETVALTEPGARNCATAARIAERYHVSASHDLGLAFDDFIVRCAVLGHWPGEADKDEVVASAVARKRQQAAGSEDRRRQIDKMVRDIRAQQEKARQRIGV